MLRLVKSGQITRQAGRIAKYWPVDHAGWPKLLPCPTCGVDRLASHAGDRLHKLCKVRAAAADHPFAV